MRAVLGVIGLSVLLFANYVDESAAADQLGGNMQCKPGSRFRLKCNWCTCSRQGRKVCTKKRCRPGADFSNEPQCEGDAVFLDEENCNTCSCHNGIAACTFKICPKPQPHPDRCQLPVDSGPCEAFFRVFRFNSETNRCEEFQYGGCQGNDNRFDTLEECQQTCGGLSSVIESAAVVPVAGGGRGRSYDQLGGNMQCKPGSRFRQKCNWCTCSSQGLKVCTQKRCLLGADISSEPQCEGDAMFLDEENCNWCSCHNGIAACTFKLCPSK